MQQEVENIVIRLKEGLRTAGLLTERMALGTAWPHPIEVESLLDELRRMYVDALSLRSPQADTIQLEPEPHSNPEPNPKAAPVSTTDTPATAPSPTVVAAVIAGQPTMEEVEGKHNEELFVDEESAPDPLDGAASQMESTGIETEQSPFLNFIAVEHTPEASEPMTPNVAPAASAVEASTTASQSTLPPSEQEDTTPLVEDKSHFDASQSTVSNVAAPDATPASTPNPTPQKAQSAEAKETVSTAEQPEPSVETQQPKEGKTPPTQSSLFDLLNQTRTVAAAATAHVIGETISAVASDHKPDLVSRQHKISDLRTVININDKFSFMNELFHNNMKAYNDFILRLNAIRTRDEALAYTREVAQQYQWDNESVTVKTFYTLFDRKF
ncbi:MAG: hypothetical protein IJ684_00105 [Bacteroidales bacterium]|nr:hypothetical protein [Bacteroidales bacterium]